MKIFKWLKRFLVGVSLFFVFVMIGYWAAMKWMDFDRFKPQLVQVMANKGVAIKVSPLHLSVKPFPFTLEINQLEGRVQTDRLPSEVTKAAFSIKKLAVQLSLWSLFVERKLKITALQWIQPEGDITVSATQQWAAATPKFSALGEIVQPQGMAPQWHLAKVALEQSKPASSLVQWALKSVFVDKGLLTIRDTHRQVWWQGHDLQLMAFDMHPNRAFPLNLQGGFRRYLPDEQDYLQGQLALNGMGQFAWQAGDLTGALTQLMGTATVALPKVLKVPPLQMQLAGAEVGYAANHLVLKGLQLKGLGSSVQLDADSDLEQTAWKGHLAMEAVDLQAWARHIHLKMPEFTDPKALTALTGHFDWQWSPQAWQLSKLDMQWDGDPIEGEVSKRSLGNQVTLNFDLKAKTLNLDRYQAKVNSLPQIEPKKSKASAKSEKNAKIPSPAGQNVPETVYLPFAIPVSTLRALQADGQLQVGDLLLNGVHFQQLNTQVTARQGVLDFAPFDFQLYGGQWLSKMQLSVAGETPAYRLKGKMKQVALQPLFQALEKRDTLRGEASSFFDLHTQGSNWDAWLGHLNGTLRMSVAKGSMAGGDLSPLLQGKPPKLGTQYHTAFDKLLVAGKIREGVYKMKTLSLKAPVLQANGYGQYNWVTQALNLHLKARLKQPQAVVPFTIAGSLKRPQWQVSVEEVLKSPENQQLILQKLGELLR